MPSPGKFPDLERTLRQLHERVRRIETGATPTRPAKRFLGADVGWGITTLDLCDHPAYTAVATAGTPTVSWGTSPCRITAYTLSGGYYQDTRIVFDEIPEITGDVRVFAKVYGTAAPAGAHVGLQAVSRMPGLYIARAGGFDNITGWSHNFKTPESGGYIASSGGSRNNQWYEVARIGNTLGFAAYGNSDPRNGGVSPILSASRTLTGSEAFDFGLGRPVLPCLLAEAGVGQGEASFSEFEVQVYS